MVTEAIPSASRESTARPATRSGAVAGCCPASARRRFGPVTIKKVGKHKASDRAPRPRSGEPEDILRHIKPDKDPARFGPLYEMVILGESGRPPGTEIKHVCPGCGREEFDNAKREFV